VNVIQANLATRETIAPQLKAKATDLVAGVRGAA
jgi:hypothetical protein